MARTNDKKRKIRGIGRSLAHKQATRNISDTTLSMDRLRVRQTLHNILYTLDQDLQWYRKRAVAKKRDDSSYIPVLYEFLEFRIRMLAPFAPFMAEELWEKIGNSSTSVILGGWP